MEPRRFSGGILGASVLIAVQYILAFFIYKLPGLRLLQGIGWGIWVLSLIFGIAPIFILRKYGGVERGNSYIQTTKLVDSSLYAIARHPQYLAGILFNLALMLLAQHWIIFSIGIISMLLIYIEILDADQEGIDRFGDEYRQYMQRVPRVNLLLGIVRLLREKDTGST